MDDRIKTIKIEDEMESSYIEYSMSVIVARALPDARDGLKPVHRRILHTMNELNLDPGKAYKKSARIVGDAMGKYHPHGDSSIYDAMVRMAQDFSMRYPLVDGHGNFGSMDGDSAAAQRYTEARLTRLSLLMLADIEKDTVDFVPNYDGELSEPTVLPAKFPNLLVNGTSGIAVGMATNIPPHNMGEVADAVNRLLDDRMAGVDTDINDLAAYVKGPDFPTGGAILGRAGIRSMYLTGRGKVVVRATAEIQPLHGGREQIVVTEIPYQVNKAKMCERIDELVRDKKIDGITDMRDESNREGVRVVIELRRDVNASVVLNQLYKFSQMQETIGVIMLALKNGEPAILNLRDILDIYIDHQRDVITRRTRFELAKTRKREHILEGYLIALEHIDEVIALIRASKDRNEAKEKLSERFSLSEAQADAIVKMQLGSLTGLEREKIEQELAEIKALIAELTLILESEAKLLSVIKEEILDAKARFADERRTIIVADSGDLCIEDLTPDEAGVVTMTAAGYVKRQPLSAYKQQKRGGKGVIGMGFREEDAIRDLFVCTAHQQILFFTSQGRAYRIKTYEIPEAGRAAKGTNIVNLLDLKDGERVAAVMPVREGEEGVLLMLTRLGIVKKTPLAEYDNIRRTGIRALNIKDGDELIGVIRAKDGDDVFVATSNGYGIRFPEAALRPLGRAAAGVRAINLDDDDFVVGCGIFEPEMQILLVSERGFGKRTEYDAFRRQHRGGRGVRVYRPSEKTGRLCGVVSAHEKDELMIINSQGVIIRIEVGGISSLGRMAQGVKLINLADDDVVVSVARVAEEVKGEPEAELE
ncbi:MAG: DNA gyrase subunit A [Clostridiales bacterium]|jgi:DNA gyrase subunit A|nr:DNA gyrase subunit A [Clostridiales bacterium]